MPNFPPDLSREIERVRLLLERYKLVGPSVAFRTAEIEQALLNAEAAQASNDPATMAQAVQTLRNFKK